MRSHSSRPAGPAVEHAAGSRAAGSWQLLAFAPAPAQTRAAVVDATAAPTRCFGHSRRFGNLAGCSASPAFAPDPAAPLRPATSLLPRWPVPARRRPSAAPPRPSRAAAAVRATTTAITGSTDPELRNFLSDLPASEPLQQDAAEGAEVGEDPSPRRHRHQRLHGSPTEAGQHQQQHHQQHQHQHQQRSPDAALLRRPEPPRAASTISGGRGSSGRRQRAMPGLLPTPGEDPPSSLRQQQQQQPDGFGGTQPSAAHASSAALPPWPWPRNQGAGSPSTGDAATSAAGFSASSPPGGPSAAHEPTSRSPGGGGSRAVAGEAAGHSGGVAAAAAATTVGTDRRPGSARPGSGGGSSSGGGGGEAPLSGVAGQEVGAQQQQQRPAAAEALFSDDDPWVAAAYDDLPVRVTGRAPPAPLLSYNELTRAPRKVPKLLLRNAAAAFRLGRPTPIQSHVIPALMEGRDVLAVSCTGSGKTLSYLLPLLAALMGRTREGSKNCAFPEALVLVPTRELAEQVHADVQVLLRGSQLKSLVVHGGVPVAEQVLAIRGRWRRSAGGVDLLVATPGRLLQLVEQRRAVRLGRLGLLVVDEADRMMELGMWPDVRRLLSQPGLPTARQTVLVAASLGGGGGAAVEGRRAPSASFPPRNQPDLSGVWGGGGGVGGGGLAGAAGELLRDGVTVQVGDGSGTSGVVRQHVELVSDDEKLNRLIELLAPGAAPGVAGAVTAGSGSGSGSGQGAAAAAPAVAPLTAYPPAPAVGPLTPGSPSLPSPPPPPPSPTVVFTRNLLRAEAVARGLAGRGVSVALLHRDLTQDQRDEALQCFRFGVTSVLVATALASRGLNFPDVAHVVNYDVPLSASVYMHQVGRTGRGGRPGLATTLVTPSNRPAAPWLLDSLRRSGSPAPAWLEQMAADARRKAAELAAARAKAAAGDGGGSRASSPPWQPRTAVALDDPAAAASVRFGSYLAHSWPSTPPLRQRAATATPADTPAAAAAAGGGGARSTGGGAPTSSPSAGVGVVVDRRHDAAYWQAVFESAIRGEQGPGRGTGGATSAGKWTAAAAAAAPAAAAASGGGAGIRRAVGSAPPRSGTGTLRGGRRAGDADAEEGMEAEETHGSGAVSVAGIRANRGGGGDRRLVYSDAAVEPEAQPGGGLTAGQGRGSGSG